MYKVLQCHSSLISSLYKNYKSLNEMHERLQLSDSPVDSWSAVIAASQNHLTMYVILT